MLLVKFASESLGKLAKRQVSQLMQKNCEFIKTFVKMLREWGRVIKTPDV